MKNVTENIGSGKYQVVWSIYQEHLPVEVNLANTGMT